MVEFRCLLKFFVGDLFTYEVRVSNVMTVNYDIKIFVMDSMGFVFVGIKCGIMYVFLLFMVLFYFLFVSIVIGSVIFFELSFGVECFFVIFVLFIELC